MTEPHEILVSLLWNVEEPSDSHPVVEPDTGRCYSGETIDGFWAAASTISCVVCDNSRAIISTTRNTTTARRC